MGFFDNLAGLVVDFIRNSWGFMKSIAGKVVNSTFGWYSGTPIDEDIAAIMIYGGGLFILVVYLFFRKALVTK